MADSWTARTKGLWVMTVMRCYLGDKGTARGGRGTGGGGRVGGGGGGQRT